MSENYIVINGKRAELTEEQLKALGIEITKPNPFERAKPGKTFYSILSTGEVVSYRELKEPYVDDKYFPVANYCTDKAIMEQRALSETLNRLLWRYSMEHKDKETSSYYTIFKDKSDSWRAREYHRQVINFGEIPFDTIEIAEAAIKEIVEPFMKEHPEFKW